MPCREYRSVQYLICTPASRGLERRRGGGSGGDGGGDGR